MLPSHLCVIETLIILNYPGKASLIVYTLYLHSFSHDTTGNLSVTVGTKLSDSKTEESNIV